MRLLLLPITYPAAAEPPYEPEPRVKDLTMALGCTGSWLHVFTSLLVLHAQKSLGHPSPPTNTTFHDDLPGSQVICTSANWYDIVWFFFANYIMHALSVRSMPGENMFTSIVFKFCCLMVPYTGLRRGLCLLSRAANLVRNDLQAAARANTLCTIVRSEEWKPIDGAEVHGCEVEKIKYAAPTEIKAQESEVKTQITCDDSSFRDHEKKDWADGALSDEKEQDQKPTTSNIQARTEEVKADFGEIKEVATSDSIEDLDDGSGTICFQILDTYKPILQRGFLEKLYKIFVQTHKFGRHALGTGPPVDPDYVKIHGMCKLAPGYKLVSIPEDVKVYPKGDPPARPSLSTALRNNDFNTVLKAMTSQTKLASTQNAPRIIFSLSQTISGGWALYRAQGAQIDRFGYAAYGLTVLPYMIVSTVNFLGSLLTKEYDMLYMVHSSIMDEMISQGGAIDGMVGTIEPTEGGEIDEPQIPALNAVVGKEEPILPEGRTLRFQTNSEEQIAYKTTDADASWSPTLSIKKPIHTQQVNSMVLVANLWRRYKQWRKRSRNSDQPKYPPNSTVISVPSHGPLTRVPPPFYDPFLHVVCLALLIAAFAVPFIVITVLTGWQARQSQSRDRNFILNWIIYGMVLGYVAGTVEQASDNKKLLKKLAIVFLSYGSYCISGFVSVVSEMIVGGSCTAVG
ncbi:uncharacterized protein KY384_007331 [Bacidia gigantensis]|uniref:uncharacterized protein n=1 Tax=Bacidia gigantensis TaxID=2732470 RepID=UPI001D0568B4|nr:uncharacterized protein KY384_007331 [Bacidia gigantensis]KAG8528413.1 hypothetical protein KY384_007331 [Bacidia gigantensis]